MKTLLSLLACLVLVLGTGCTTQPDGSKKVDSQKVAYAVEDAAFIGTRVALMKNAEWRPAFEDAATALAILETKDSIGIADIMEIARSLHVRELKSEQATLVITGAELLLVNLDRQTIDLKKVEALKPVVSAFRKGIQRALAL
jgi:hypothetical protein